MLVISDEKNYDWPHPLCSSEAIASDVTTDVIQLSRDMKAVVHSDNKEIPLARFDYLLTQYKLVSAQQVKKLLDYDFSLHDVPNDISVPVAVVPPVREQCQLLIHQYTGLLDSLTREGEEGIVNWTGSKRKKVKIRSRYLSLELSISDSCTG